MGPRHPGTGTPHHFKGGVGQGLLPALGSAPAQHTGMVSPENTRTAVPAPETGAAFLPQERMGPLRRARTRRLSWDPYVGLPEDSGLPGDGTRGSRWCEPPPGAAPPRSVSVLSAMGDVQERGRAVTPCRAGPGWSCCPCGCRGPGAPRGLGLGLGQPGYFAEGSWWRWQ